MTPTAGVRQSSSAISECRVLVRSTGKLSVKRDTVKAAEAVGKSSAAMNALGNGQLSLEEAAAISEFDVMWTSPAVNRAASPNALSGPGGASGGPVGGLGWQRRPEGTLVGMPTFGGVSFPPCGSQEQN
jgi:hypothetical protein